jgi:hypothetical protein
MTPPYGGHDARGSPHRQATGLHSTRRFILIIADRFCYVHAYSPPCESGLPRLRWPSDRHSYPREGVAPCRPSVPILHASVMPQTVSSPVLPGFCTPLRSATDSSVPGRGALRQWASPVHERLIEGGRHDATDGPRASGPEMSDTALALACGLAGELSIELGHDDRGPCSHDLDGVCQRL